MFVLGSYPAAVLFCVITRDLVVIFLPTHSCYERFPGLGQPRRNRDDIHIQAANNDDPCHLQP
jgi:hypothetical protein